MIWQDVVMRSGVASHGVLSLRPLRSLRLKHQSRVGSFSAERGNAFYTIYTFYTAKICVGLRNDCFRAGAEIDAYPPSRRRAARFACRAAIRLPDEQREEPCAARSQEVERWLQGCGFAALHQSIKFDIIFA